MSLAAAIIMPRNSIYWIHHPDHTDMFTQGYIGVSVDPNRRLHEHRYKSQNTHLKYAINKYGWNTLIKKTVLIGSKDYCLNIEKKLRPIDDIGWNIVAGGGCPPPAVGNKFRAGRPAWNKGIPSSASTRKKISDSVTLQMQNPARREINRQLLIGKPSLMLGRKHSAESLLKMSLVKLGKPSTRQGFKHSAATIQRMRELAMQESWECPHCHTQGKSKSAGNRWHFDRCKMKEVTSCH